MTHRESPRSPIPPTALNSPGPSPGPPIRARRSPAASWTSTAVSWRWPVKIRPSSSTTSAPTRVSAVSGSSTLPMRSSGVAARSGAVAAVGASAAPQPATSGIARRTESRWCRGMGGPVRGAWRSRVGGSKVARASRHGQPFRFRNGSTGSGHFRTPPWPPAGAENRCAAWTVDAQGAVERGFHVRQGDSGLTMVPRIAR